MTLLRCFVGFSEFNDLIIEIINHIDIQHPSYDYKCVCNISMNFCLYNLTFLSIFAVCVIDSIWDFPAKSIVLAICRLKVHSASRLVLMSKIKWSCDYNGNNGD